MGGMEVAHVTLESVVSTTSRISVQTSHLTRLLPLALWNGICDRQAFLLELRRQAWARGRGHLSPLCVERNFKNHRNTIRICFCFTPRCGDVGCFVVSDYALAGVWSC